MLGFSRHPIPNEQTQPAQCIPLQPDAELSVAEIFGDCENSNSPASLFAVSVRTVCIPQRTCPGVALALFPLSGLQSFQGFTSSSVSSSSVAHAERFRLPNQRGDVRRLSRENIRVRK